MVLYLLSWWRMWFVWAWALYYVFLRILLTGSSPFPCLKQAAYISQFHLKPWQELCLEFCTRSLYCSSGNQTPDPWSILELGKLHPSQAAASTLGCPCWASSWESITGGANGIRGQWITKLGISWLTRRDFSLSCPKVSLWKMLRLTKLFFFSELKPCRSTDHPF